MARRNEHTQGQLKEMILNAAQYIVVEQGFSALTVRKIAAKINYTVGSIYMIFTNMDDLILQLKAVTLNDITQQIEQISHYPPEQYLEEMAKTYLRFASQNFNQWSMIFEHRLPEGTTTPDWYQLKVEEAFQRVETQFKRLTPSCSQAQIARAARALWGGIHGICALSLNEKLNSLDIYDVESNVVLLVRNFVQGWIHAADN
ncbi:MAG: TetR/AcrR family transcriptional regulator [Methylococcales bacterium]